jgi:RNA polymerase sigma factor (sigma-70 family)
MAGGSTGTDLLHQLSTLFQVGVVGDLSDAQLLHQFLVAPDAIKQAVFSALVTRHGLMVTLVCRQVLGNSHDAQDAFQATFLILARKAASIRKAESVASWLHGVALRVATRAKSEAARRRTHERRGGVIRAMTSDAEADGPGSWPELHEEIARLPERYREPVVLCYLEGLSVEEAALKIGCPRGTVLSRLSRARERLRGRLIRRGLATPEEFPTEGPTQRLGAGLPPVILETTVRESLRFIGRNVTEATSASTKPTLLARGEIHAMTISKLKLIASAALAIACVLAGARVFAIQKPDNPPEVAKSEPARPSVAPWRYEYESVRLVYEGQLADKANEESAKGWEVFEVVPVVNGSAGNSNTKYTMLFRRPVDVKK